MDKNFLLRLNKSFKQIKTQLLLNEKIRTLLYYDIVNDSTVVPVIDQVKDHIFIQPVIDVDVTEPFNKKNYITITVPEGERVSNKMNYVIRIIIMCDKSSWNLNDDVRPLLIAQEVCDTLDGFKTELSNKLVFSNIVETVTSKDVYGYSVLFDSADGISDIDEKI